MVSSRTPVRRHIHSEAVSHPTVTLARASPGPAPLYDGPMPSELFDILTRFGDRADRVTHVEALLRADALECGLMEAVKDESGEDAAMDLNLIEAAQGKDGTGVVNDLGGNVGCALKSGCGEGFGEPGSGGVAGCALLAMGFQGNVAISIGKSAKMIEPLGDVVVSLHFLHLLARIGPLEPFSSL